VVGRIRTSNAPPQGVALFTADAIQDAWRASVARMLELTNLRFGLLRFCPAPMYADAPTEKHEVIRFP
jgi:hypothetical protein